MKTDSSERQTRFIDVDSIIEGSAMRALRVSPAFDRYIFVEKSAHKSASLRELGQKFPMLKERIEVITKDANEALRDLCLRTNWRRCRAVVFLDPFGLTVEWDTVERLARTQAVDLWYLVPTGIGINRQVTKDGRFLEENCRRVDAILGTKAWRSRVVRTETMPVDLFGEVHTRNVKYGGVDEIAGFVLERLAGVFKGGVAKYGLSLGSQGRAMYTLVFACANPTPKASQLALRLANAILKT